MAVKYALLFLLLCGNANATDYILGKLVDPGPFSAALTAAGITADQVACKSGVCVAFNASDDPSAIVASYTYVNPVDAEAARRAQIVTLVKSLRQGTATQTQKDNLLALLVLEVLGQ